MFSDIPEIKQLLEISAELADIATSAGVLSWDQETQMPKGGAKLRSYQLSTLAGIYHERSTRKEVITLLGKIKTEVKKYSEWDMALVREMEREYERATKLPKELVVQLSEATSRGFEAWQNAKKQNDFLLFAKELEKILELKIQAAKLVRKEGQTIYDTMLDDHEEDLTEKTVERVFAEVRPALTEMIQKFTPPAKDADEVIKNKEFSLEAQWELGISVLEDMGYDFDRGRQDTSAHPFTIGFGSGDVRITTWKDNADFRPALYASIHEGGHALYEQGVREEFDRTHLAGGQGLVLHESQSRLWENLVGRSETFWKAYEEKFRKLFPQMEKTSLEQIIGAVNVVRPSLIRVEADEVTYAAHIILRYELEKDLVEGKIKVADLPEKWNGKMQELLGMTPKSESEGVLQDVHWSHGSFGYFPTYLLGTIAASQIWQVMRNQGVVGQTLDMPKIRAWLKENIHQHGKVFTSAELIQRVCKEPLNAKYFVDYLKQKYEALYGEGGHLR